MGIIYGSDYSAQVPPPPPLPKYDKSQEEPKWSMSRLLFGFPPEKPEIPYAKLGETPKEGQADWRGVLKENVREWPMPEIYKNLGRKYDPKYYFFDTPDYADPFKKLAWASRIFLAGGVFLGSVWHGLYLGEKMTLPSFTRMMSKIALPCFFAGVAGSLTVSTVSNLRGKKDDYINYIAAGLVFSSIIGRKDHLCFFGSAVFYTPLAYMFKYVNENNIQFIPRVNWGGSNSPLSGYSADNGIASGDLRLGFRSTYGDPGRDVRKTF